VLGGGNAKKMDVLPAKVRLGGNDNAFVGRFRLCDLPGGADGSPQGRAATKMSV
jgi:hypothetical protein